MSYPTFCWLYGNPKQNLECVLVELTCGMTLLCLPGEFFGTAAKPTSDFPTGTMEQLRANAPLSHGSPQQHVPISLQAARYVFVCFKVLEHRDKHFVLDLGNRTGSVSRSPQAGLYEPHIASRNRPRTQVRLDHPYTVMKIIRSDNNIDLTLLLNLSKNRASKPHFLFYYYLHAHSVSTGATYHLVFRVYDATPLNKLFFKPQVCPEISQSLINVCKKKLSST